VSDPSLPLTAFHALLAWARANPGLITGLWILSVVSFFGTLLAMPMMVVRMPEDYFLYDRAHLREYRRQHPVFRLFSVVLKNILGVVFILAGIIMLFLPGQGVLTILIGITLVSFPRKRSLELRLVRKPSVLRALNWMRARAHKPPLMLP
jgi:hypothetical protein